MLHQISYILLDAARMGDVMDEAKTINPVHDSLYRGRSEESLSAVAPYIFAFRQRTEFINWYMNKGWGDSWGVLLQSDYPMEEVHKHFRKFLIVATEDEQQLYFRFYDPRVLRIFLPTCDEEQLADFFSLIDYFVLENEDKGFATRYWLENRQLRTQQISMDQLKDPTAAIIPISRINKPAAFNLFDNDAPKTTPGGKNTGFEQKTANKPPKNNWNMFID